MPREQQVRLLPKAIKAWRKQRELSQMDLARAAGCSEGLIAQIETGRRQPGLTNAVGIARALGVELGALGDIYVDDSTLAAAASSPEEAA